jgi:hypothetical protein
VGPVPTTLVAVTVNV